MALPYVTAEVEPVIARFRELPEDFEVDEIPAYAPTGEGEHVFAHIEKRLLTTRDAVRALCDALALDPRSAGWAGLKDRYAITRQWISLQGTTPQAVLQCEVEGVRVLRAASHPQKLRTGHLRENRFRIRLREIDPQGLDRLRRVLSLIERRGLPNYYGEQRFGRAGDNATRALRWVRGEARPPRDGFQRKLQMSALQGDLFNRYVSERMQTSTFAKVLAGDLMKKHGSGGLFTVEDVALEQERADRWETSPTGPIFGAKMRWPEAEARAREESLLRSSGLTPEHFAAWKRVAPGTRRWIRVPLSEIGLTVCDHTVTLEFTLPSGSYATILMREVLKRDAPSGKSG